MKENFKESIESGKIKFLSELIKKEMPDSDPVDWIKKENTLVISGGFLHEKNIHSTYIGVRNLLDKTKDYFKDIVWEDNGEGISANLVNPIGNINKVTICITKVMD
jgi:hypothetical protein